MKKSFIHKNKVATINKNNKTTAESLAGEPSLFIQAFHCEAGRNAPLQTINLNVNRRNLEKTSPPGLDGQT
jgi:hypothetical protein